MLVYDVSHHRILKSPFSSVHTKMNEELMFSTLESVFEKLRFHRIRVDGRLNHSGDQNSRFQTKMDTCMCGRSLSAKRFL